MNSIYKISFLVYRLILLILMPLFFISIFFVGFAGHSPNFNFIDVAIILYFVITLIILTIFKNLSRKSSLLTKINFISFCLVLPSVFIVLYNSYNQITFLINKEFKLGDLIVVILLITFLFLCIVLNFGFLKSKVY